MSCKVKEIILRVASCALWVEKLKNFIYELPLAFNKLIVKVMFTSCEVAFYKLNINDANFTNYRHMVESNFKGINLPEMYEKAILIKCILTLDNSNTH